MSRTHDWLNLVEVSGPFLAEQVLNKTLPDGLDTLQQGVAPRLRSAYNEWRDAVDAHDKDIDELHMAWLDEVLFGVLEYDDRCLKRDSELSATLTVALPEHGVELSPDMMLLNPSKPEEPLLLISKYDPDLDLNKTLKIDGLASTPSERMVTLLRRTGNVLGLVTNGEAWMLVHAPSGAVASYTTWYARMFGQARDTLRAFASLLGIHRFTGPSVDTLPSLFELSLEHQADVTEALGDQVAKAIEVLMRALDRADQDRNRDLLRDVAPFTLYEAGLTLMMRLVFILSAEERGLLLSGDPIYDSHYAISSLRSQLSGTDPAILERRNSAWSRMLATFRLVHDGVDHPDLRLPALGGSLFDPDRFPFLEGRKNGSDWHEDPADPLPIDDRTVLLLLEAIQVLKGRNLSYRALDVEQIGHVYEGLLDQTVGRVEGITLQLKGSAKIGTPLIQLQALESAQNKSSDDLLALLEERTERSVSALQNDVATPLEKETAARLLTGCRGDAALRDRILPFANLLANDPWGLPLVHHAGAIVIVHGTDRRESGAHYTPKSLTEKIVEETLDPVVYRGPAEGVPRAEWQLKTPAEILDLKICDPAMGSGAFLVQVCRWLAERLLESWSSEEDKGRHIDVEGHVLDDANDVSEPLPRDPEERATLARRMIAEKCLYGVDINPLAVELAKLSLWLTTLAKGRPFGFLDHNLKSGDSLLGISNLEQLIELDMNPKQRGQLRLFGRSIRKSVEEATELRSRLREIPVRDITDVEAMARLDGQSRRILDLPKLVGDAFVGGVLADKKATDRNARIETIAALSDDAAAENGDAAVSLEQMASEDLAVDAPNGRPRRPFHWPLEFPEVFGRENGGFDAIVGNPPFLGNTSWKASLGFSYVNIIRVLLGGAPGKIDLSVVFHRRAQTLTRSDGVYGLLAANNICEGQALKVGLEVIVQAGTIVSSARDMVWLGQASVITAYVVYFNGEYSGEKRANGEICEYIGPRLKCASSADLQPKPLAEGLFAFKGVDNSRGLSFIVKKGDEWCKTLKTIEDTRLTPYITGNDITTNCLREIDRWALDIGDLSLEEITSENAHYDQFLNNVVKPTRTGNQLKSYKGLEKRWWQFWNHRAKQFSRLRKNEHCIVFSRVTKHPICIEAPSSFIYTEGVILIEESRRDTLAICQSAFFSEWLIATQGAKFGVGGTLRIALTEGISTFPLPRQEVSSEGLSLASELDQLIKLWSAENDSGTTGFGNALAQKSDTSEIVSRGRELYKKISIEVAKAYDDAGQPFDIDFGFFKAPHIVHKEEVAFCLSQQSREQVVERIKIINNQRHQEEVAKGLHGKVEQAKKKQSAPRKNKQTVASAPSLDLEPPTSATKVEEPKVAKLEPPTERLYNWLYNQNGKWVPKNQVASATGLVPEEVDKAVRTLVADDDLLVRGEGEDTLLKVKG